MKIYNNQHEIKIVSKVEDSHIPLAYMHGDEKVYQTQVIQEQRATGIRKIIPYERFDSYEKAFFSSHTNNPQTLADLVAVQAGDFLKRDNNGYYYEPEVSVKFEPLRFSYSVLCKRTQQYSAQRIYNQRVSCIDKDDLLADELIQIFADAPSRGLVKDNVWINSKDLSVNSLSSRPLLENDMVFIQTGLGETYASNNEKIDYEHYLTNHVNIWLCCSDIKTLEKGEAVLNKNILYNDTVSCSEYTFLTASYDDKYLPSGGQTITMFRGNAIACIVKYYENKGFVIISTDRFIIHASQNYRMIYEVMMQIFLMSYVKSETYYSFVCDESIDYTVKHNQLYANHLFRSEKPYYEFFNSYYVKDFKLIAVNLSDTKNVAVGQAPDYIYFKKIGNRTDPIKPIGSYSILLDTQEVVFVNKWLYVAETQIPYSAKRQNDMMLLTLSPFCSNHVFEMSETNLTLPLTQTQNYEVTYIEDIVYYVVYKDMQYLITTEEDWDGFGKLLLQVAIHLVDAPIALIDMRVRGGGLPENKADNYRLMDIGHLEGRPLRQAGAYLIKLPIEAQKYHNDILKKVQQINAAERFFTIIYEQRKD